MSRGTAIPTQSNTKQEYQQCYLSAQKRQRYYSQNNNGE
jgi:hypothetical protein